MAQPPLSERSVQCHRVAAAASAEVYRAEDFPGCEPFHLSASEVERYEGRLEFWDARTETAWKVSEPTSIQHEQPSRRLVHMATRFEALRGSRIACFGASDLVRRDETGRKRWLMQADEVLYLYPERMRLVGPAIDVDADPLPEVVLEVDHSTDVRRRKLGIYEESGFPEIWVLVPWESSVRSPGLTIHVRRGRRYREEVESRAFPGWRAEEIHCALTEDPVSTGAVRALERVALAMGAREGTRPEDDPFTRSISRKADARGYERGRRQMLEASVRAVLKARGIEAALPLPEDRKLLSYAPGRSPGGGGARLHRRSRLPAPGPGAARPPHRDRALTRSGRSGKHGQVTGESGGVEGGAMLFRESGVAISPRWWIIRRRMAGSVTPILRPKLGVKQKNTADQRAGPMPRAASPCPGEGLPFPSHHG